MADSKFTQTLKALVEVVGGVTVANGFDFDLDVQRDTLGEQRPRPYRCFVTPAPSTSFRLDLQDGAPQNLGLYQRILRFVAEVNVPGKGAPEDEADNVDKQMLDVQAAIEQVINANSCLKTADYPTGAASLTWVGETGAAVDAKPPTIYLEILAAVTYVPDTIVS